MTAHPERSAAASSAACPYSSRPQQQHPALAVCSRNTQHWRHDSGPGRPMRQQLPAQAAAPALAVCSRNTSGEETARPSRTPPARHQGAGPTALATKAVCQYGNGAPNSIRTHSGCPQYTGSLQLQHQSTAAERNARQRSTVWCKAAGSARRQAVRGSTKCQIPSRTRQSTLQGSTQSGAASGAVWHRSDTACSARKQPVRSSKQCAAASRVRRHVQSHKAV